MEGEKEETKEGLHLGGGDSEGGSKDESRNGGGQNEADNGNGSQGYTYQGQWEPMYYDPWGGYGYGEEYGMYPGYWMGLLTKEEIGKEIKEEKVEDENPWKVSMTKKTRRALMAMDRGKVPDGYERVRIEGVMDSGAYDTIGYKGLFGGDEIRQTEASKKGMNYYAVNGGEVKNMGEADLKGVSDDGVPIAFTAQVGDKIKKLLISIRRAASSGNMVIFGADLKAIRDLAKLDKIESNLIVGVKSRVRSEIQDKHGMYVYPMTITRKRKNKEDSMDVGMIEKEDESEEEVDEWTPF